MVKTGICKYCAEKFPGRGLERFLPGTALRLIAPDKIRAYLQQSFFINNDWITFSIPVNIFFMFGF